MNEKLVAFLNMCSICCTLEASKKVSSMIYSTPIFPLSVALMPIFLMGNLSESFEEIRDFRNYLFVKEMEEQDKKNFDIDTIAPLAQVFVHVPDEMPTDSPVYKVLQLLREYWASFGKEVKELVPLDLLHQTKSLVYGNEYDYRNTYRYDMSECHHKLIENWPFLSVETKRDWLAFMVGTLDFEGLNLLSVHFQEDSILAMFEEMFDNEQTNTLISGAFVMGSLLVKADDFMDSPSIFNILFFNYLNQTGWNRVMEERLVDDNADAYHQMCEYASLALDEPFVQTSESQG